MADKLYDYIYEKLQEPVKVYLNKETKELLEHDCESFGIATRNEFYNLLVSNYISEYVEHLEESGKRILSIMDEMIVARNRDELPVIARKIAWKNATAEDYKERGEYESIRINSYNTDPIAEMISSAADSVKVSVFFRNLFLNYLSLPAYRREQIIFIDSYNTIMKALKDGLKISYRNKNKKKSHTLSVYSLEQSDLEFHNYLIGSFGQGKGAASIKLLSIETVRILNEKAVFDDTFEECYKAMEDNGCQFGIGELKYWKLYLTDEDLNTYKSRYIERPKIYSRGEDEKGKYCIFNCSDFQLKGFFMPFKKTFVLEECLANGTIKKNPSQVQNLNP